MYVCVCVYVCVCYNHFHRSNLSEKKIVFDLWHRLAARSPIRLPGHRTARPSFRPFACSFSCSPIRLYAGKVRSSKRPSVRISVAQPLILPTRSPARRLVKLQKPRRPPTSQSGYPLACPPSHQSVRSSKGRIAVRLLTHTPARPVTIRQLARLTGSPPTHLYTRLISRSSTRLIRTPAHQSDTQTSARTYEKIDSIWGTLSCS